MRKFIAPKFFQTVLSVSLTFIFIVTFTNFGFSQSGKLKVTYQEGEDFFQSEDYKEAIYYFLQLEQNGYINSNIQFKIGTCYLNIPGEEVKAIPYLQEAVKHITNKYRTKDLSERKAPLHSLFFLGNVYRINNQLDKALEAYDKFIKSPDYDGNYNLNIVELEIKACERAKIIQDSPIDVVWHNSGEPINTASSETYPALSGDGKVMAYLTSLKFYNAIYVTRKFEGKWQVSENINPQILSDGDFYPTALSYDGSELYLVKKSISNSDIYVSVLKDGKWSAAKALNENINSSKNETYAAITADNKILYFASNRHGGRGGYDIYKSVKDKNNDWGKAENLGKSINTKLDDISPSITLDGKTLYFSSKGHYNMGGFDIFISTTTDDKKWSLPVNIGYPVNTTNDNIGFQVIGEGKSGYISRIAPDGFGKEDIYEVEIKSHFIQKLSVEE